MYSFEKISWAIEDILKNVEKNKKNKVNFFIMYDNKLNDTNRGYLWNEYF